jgi:1-deoxy-D-xylulose-5-phosphate synthase
MGLYDIAYMLAVPGMTVTAPRNATEMLALLRTALRHEGGPLCLRYPRDPAPDVPLPIAQIPPVPMGTWEVLRQGAECAILAVGTMVQPALEAADTLAHEGLNATVVNCRFLKPHDDVTLTAIVANHSRILTVEEGTVVNGFGAMMAVRIQQLDPAVHVAVHGAPDRFIEQGSRRRQLERTGLDAAGIAQRLRAMHESEAMTG